MGLMKRLHLDGKQDLVVPPTTPDPLAPPPYSGLASTEDLAKLDLKWDTKRNSRWKRTVFNLELKFKSSGQLPGREWVAWMNVLATNIPRLMKYGFHWSAANVIPADGFITVDDDTLSAARKAQGWKHSRTYSLKDRDGGKEWTSKIKVLGKTLAGVAAFDIDSLSLNELVLCKVWNWKKQIAYYYDRDDPAASMNVIFDKMPLEGWWPWPKAREDEKARAEENALDDET